jgi:histidinol dehydrogenase
MIPIVDAGNTRAIEALLAPPAERDASVADQARDIVEDVRRRGDRALRAFARRFDGLSGPIEVGADEIAEAARAVPAAVRRALRQAARHIRTVARAQVPRPARVVPAPGVVVEQRVVPLARVGCYVPGGRYPLPSSLLMTAIPARVAGVPEVIAVCPRPDAAVMAAALEAGVTRLFRVGGAHAVAALAYGTASVPRVDKIVGPGNAYVSAAKAIVARDCAIDFYAGPSEIVVVSARGPAAWIAADLIAQAEHDPLARAVFITWSRRLAREVAREVALRAPAAGPAIAALANCGAIVVTRDRSAAIALADRFAPEHLVCDDDAVVAGVRAGAVFVGPHTAQAAGDYATGSNHVLPTSGAARFRGGLSAADFVRVHSVQRLTAAGLRGIAPAVVALAEAEGLRGHAESIRVRLS